MNMFDAAPAMHAGMGMNAGMMSGAGAMPQQQQSFGVHQPNMMQPQGFGMQQEMTPQMQQQNLMQQQGFGMQQGMMGGQQMPQMSGFAQQPGMIPQNLQQQQMMMMQQQQLQQQQMMMMQQGIPGMPGMQGGMADGKHHGNDAASVGRRRDRRGALFRRRRVDAQGTGKAEDAPPSRVRSVRAVTCRAHRAAKRASCLF
jgi:hypothetical protein